MQERSKQLSQMKMLEFYMRNPADISSLIESQLTA